MFDASRGKIAAFAYPREMTGKEYTGCVIYCCCSDLSCCLGMLTRVEVRRRFSIEGDMCQVSNDSTPTIDVDAPILGLL